MSMDVRSRSIAILSALLLSGGAAFAQQRAAAGSGGADAAIAKVRAAYQAAASAQDGEALARLFAPDGVEMPPNAPMQKGRAAIAAYHKQFAAQMMVHNLAITPTETKVMGNVAYDVGTYTQMLMPTKSGGKNIDDKGKYVVLLKKDAAGNWAISHAIYNSDLPPPAAAAPKK